AATTVQGIGAAFSTTLAGFIIVSGGYSMAFLALAGIALLGLVVFLVFMPETLAERSSQQLTSPTRSGRGEV
ncbi:MAG: hypothetical protein ABI369_08970, partial [Acetobacteraceae bacterium]